MKNPIFQSKPGNVYFAREQKNDFNWDGPAKGNQKNNITYQIWALRRLAKHEKNVPVYRQEACLSCRSLF